MKPLSFFAAAGTALVGATSAFASPEVVVSIKPIHSLTAAIMKGVGEPQLIVDGAASPHTFSMKPSNARALQNADLVVWVGHGMETFLEKPLGALAAKAEVVALEDAPGLEKLALREGGPFEAHGHGDEDHDDHAHAASEDHSHNHDEHDHDHGTFDTHLWLNPVNAKAMAQAIERSLIKVDPANEGAYQANTAELLRQIDALDAEIKTTVAPVKDKAFIVFHDAYQYFEKRYDMTVAGSITVSPEMMPGAERLKEIRKKVADLGATCVFSEPQFEPKLVAVVTEGTAARSGTLDPEAATLEAGPDLYFEMMRGLARSITECLSQRT
jgi:ABC-type Zn2+ transport system, periplasmic component/surface adhesin